ncbi:orc-3 [Pristionchus pacificus]|uniref:Orc-3 n=1 Tax=Pristionchus pacificus TaxID=54126 RepID=A0A454XRJ8_PRIPA|nr:orc-3 [Pristionchus pacificus]|eukprot:PDM65669.1 orc-3 [Pristionchus pacificus]
MSVVLTSHKRHLSVPDSFKSCVASKNARTDGGRELETSLEYFTAKIKEVERKVVDATQIVDFLVTANDENLTDNHYLRTKTKKIRTAVVKCNFADSETLMASVAERCRNHKVEQIIVSSNATSVQDTLEEVKEKTRHTIIIIERLESMDVDLFNRLVALLHDDDTLDVSLLVCICTSRSAFVSHCSSDNLDRLYPKFIELPSPQNQFDEVAAVLTRNEDEKAPKLYLSGELLALLKKRFLHGDFSLSELKKTVRLSIVENFLKYDEYMEKEDDDFLERLPAYWEWFDAFADCLEAAYLEMNIKDPLPGRIDLHAELQRHPKTFWKEHKAVENFRTWLCEKTRTELCDIISNFAAVVKDVSPASSCKLLDRVESLRAEAAAAAAAPPTAPFTPGGGPAKVAKLTMTELLAANRAKQEASKVAGNRLRDAVGELMGMLRERLFAWSDYEDYLLMVPSGIEVPDISRSLMTRADRPLSHAYTALAGVDQFKAVPITRWGGVVAERMGNAEFYDCVAQMERMGVVKDASKQGKRAVMLQHRPMMNFN